MSLKSRLPLLAAALLVASSDPLAAQAIAPGSEGELANFVQPEDGARACFSRTYDAAHLKKHPKQTVTEMQFRIAYYVHEPDQFFPLGQRNYYFELDARVKGQGRKLTTGGECRVQPGTKTIVCGVECDGGGVLVSKTGKDGRIVVDLEATGRLRMTLGCDDEDETNAVELTPGEDDKTFLLSPTPVAACPIYEDW